MPGRLRRLLAPHEELFKDVGCEFTCESQCRASHSCAYRVFALHSPGIREEIGAGHAAVSRVCGCHGSICAVCHEGQAASVSDAIPETLIDGVDVTRVFTPRRTQAGFESVTRGIRTQPRSVALAETFPMRSIFPRSIPRRSPTRAD